MSELQSDNTFEHADATGAPLLEAKGLYKHYLQRSGALGLTSKKVRALDNVSLSVRPASTLAIVGESGCGKSTLARCLLQLLPFEQGQVLFEGQDLAALSKQALRQQRRYLQMIFQDPFASLNPRMTVLDIVGEGLLIHGMQDAEQRRAAVVQMLQRVGLTEADTSKYPHQFSGGQRQRIGIARALVLSPKLVVCDEPVSALDVSIQAQILLLLKSLQQEMQLSYLFISHDLRVVRHMADEIAVMQAGRIVETGSVEAIYGNPQQAYTQQLLQAIPGRGAIRQ